MRDTTPPAVESFPHARRGLGPASCTIVAGDFYNGVMLKTIACLATAVLLAGCGSAGFGIGVPVGPFSIGVGVGSDGGLTTGVGTGWGPFGVGVGVNQAGQVTGGAGVGASVPLGSSPVRAGVGVGTGTVLYDPNRAQAMPPQQGIPILQPRPVVPRAGAGDLVAP